MRPRTSLKTFRYFRQVSKASSSVLSARSPCGPRAPFRQSAWRPVPGSAATTSAISIGSTRREEKTRKSSRLRFIAPRSMQPAHGVLGMVLDADLEVQTIRGEPHGLGQRYHIVLGLLQ